MISFRTDVSAFYNLQEKYIYKQYKNMILIDRYKWYSAVLVNYLQTWPSTKFVHQKCTNLFVSKVSDMNILDDS